MSRGRGEAPGSGCNAGVVAWGLRLRKFPAIEPLEKNDMQGKAFAGTGQKQKHVFAFSSVGEISFGQKNVRFSAAVLRPPVVG